MKKLIFNKLGKDIAFFFTISVISLAAIIWIIQAVNYLDLVSEDGHSIKIYFLYTLFSLPKIISRIVPFIFMISVFYTLLKYELNNELMIYWMTGISKINLVNAIIKISFLYFLLQIFFTTILVPESLDKGRSFFRTSDVDMFTTIIKKKKFIDSVENLTIFVEKKNGNLLENILIKETVNSIENQIIIAQKGQIINSKDNKNIILTNGKIINTENNNQNIIDFLEFNLDLSKFNSNTISNPKTQDMNSKNLILCVKKLKEYSFKEKNLFFQGCSTEIRGAIYEEFLKRFFSPLFIFLIGISTSLILLINKDQEKYKFKTFLVFFLSVSVIIISEISLRYTSSKFDYIYFYLMMPLVASILIYLLINISQKHLNN